MIDTSEPNKTATPEAIELREALVDYKQTSGRMFPTCSEVLEVVRSLGYERLTANVETEVEHDSPVLEPEGVTA